ncbi:MAG: DUF4430 domain-containing protein [Pirellulales bacterium]
MSPAATVGGKSGVVGKSVTLFSTGRRAALVALCLAWLLVGAVGQHAPGSLRAEEPATTVELTVDYGDGAQKRWTFPFRPGTTILELLQEAQRHRRGLQFQYRGSGDTAFLTRIDDLENEGRGKNWTYRVNDRPGDRSFAAYRLAAGDRVLWRFGVYREEP